MLNRDAVFAAFRRALLELSAEIRTDGIRPRTVAVRAHEIYCSELGPGEKKPALVTFRKFVAGRSALPEIVDLLQKADVRPAVRARLDRRRLRSVFQEAIQRLETRLIRGQVRPLQVARRAYELYTRDAVPETSQPSHHTFQRLIYGKAADPEIVTLIETALKGKD